MNDDYSACMEYENQHATSRLESIDSIYSALVENVVKAPKNRSSIVYKQSALEKTLQRAYQKILTKTSPNQVDKDCSYGSFIEFYSPGSSTYKLAPLNYRVNNPEDESFTTVCWESFRLFAQKHEDSHRNKRGANECIPVTKIGKVVQTIMYTVTPQHINFVADYFGLLDDRNTTLSWGDFRQFMHQIVETMPSPKIQSLASPSGANPKSKSNQMSRSQDTSDNMNETVRSRGHEMQADLTCAKGIIYLSSLSNQPGLNASRNFAKEEMLGMYRREEQFRREIEEKARAGEIV